MPINLTDYRVIVRRIASGKSPYRWEIQQDGFAAVLHSSDETFGSMYSAYEVGQVRLLDYVASMTKPARRQNKAPRLGPDRVGYGTQRR